MANTQPAGALFWRSSFGVNRIADTGSASGWVPATCPDRNVQVAEVPVDRLNGALRVAAIVILYWPAAAGTVSCPPSCACSSSLTPSLYTVVVAVSVRLYPVPPVLSLYIGGAKIIESPVRVAHCSGISRAGNDGPKTPWFDVSR